MDRGGELKRGLKKKKSRENIRAAQVKRGPRLFVNGRGCEGKWKLETGGETEASPG